MAIEPTTKPINWAKYLVVLIITALIFATALYASNYLGEKKISDIKTIQDKLAIDILSSETQFSLLENASCKDIASTTALSDELSNVGDRLNYAESQNVDNDAVRSLKENYSLLEIKDYLLAKQIAEKCKTTPVSIIYFYSNTDGECVDCEKEGYVLTQLRQDFPTVRVYSFDYDIDLSAVKTLASISKIQGNLPALIVGDTTYTGFQPIETLEGLQVIKALVPVVPVQSNTIIGTKVATTSPNR